MSVLPPPPSGNSLIVLDPNRKSRKDPFYISKEWLDWLQLSLVPGVQAAAPVITTYPVTNQNAAILTTALPTKALTGGTYRLSWYLRVTTLDGTSSSATVTLGWTDGGVPCTETFPAVNSDSNLLPGSGSALVQVDGASAITYAVAYASHTANKMVYKLLIAVEQLA